MTRLLIIIIVTIHSNQLFAQWTQTNGPAGVSNEMVFVQGKIFLSSGYSGIQVSNDFGETWEIKWAPASGITQRIVRDGDRIYISTLSELFYSDDLGDNWTAVNTQYGIGGPMSIRGDEIVFQSIFGPEIWYTSDFGLSWQELESPVPGQYFQVELIGDEIWAQGGSSVYTSDDFGASWNESAFNATHYIDRVYNFGQNIYLGASLKVDPNQNRLLVSNNSGQSITELSFAFPGRFSAVNDDGSILSVICQGDFLLASDDNGVTWTTKPMPTYSTALIRDGQKVGVANWNSFYVSEDNGDTWEPREQTLVRTTVEKIIDHEDNLLAIGRRFAVSPDNGNSWEYRTTGLYEPLGEPFGAVVSVAKGTGKIFIGTTDGVYSSTDLGLSWTKLLSLEPNRSIQSISWWDGKLVASSYDKTFYSEDDGITWNENTDPTLVDDNYYASLLIDNLILMASDRYFMVSQDFGNTWVARSIQFRINEIKKLDDRIVVATYRGVFATSNLGIIWDELNSNLVGAALSITEKDGKWFVTTNNGVFLSVDKGKNWYPLNQGLENIFTYSLTFLNENAFVGTHGLGVWKSPIDKLNVRPIVRGLLEPITMDNTRSHTLEVTDLKIDDPDSSYPADFVLLINDGDNYMVDQNKISASPEFQGKLFVPVAVSDGSTTSEFVNITLSVGESPPSDIPTDVITAANDRMEDDHVYPNPFTDFIVATNGGIFSDSFAIFNSLGQKVKEVDCNGTNPNCLINTENLPVGIYFLKRMSPDRTTVQRMIKIQEK